MESMMIEKVHLEDKWLNEKAVVSRLMNFIPPKPITGILSAVK